MGMEGGTGGRGQVSGHRRRAEEHGGPFKLPRSLPALAPQRTERDGAGRFRRPLP